MLLDESILTISGDKTTINFYLKVTMQLPLVVKVGLCLYKIQIAICHSMNYC